MVRNGNLWHGDEKGMYNKKKKQEANLKEGISCSSVEVSVPLQLVQSSVGRLKSTTIDGLCPAKMLHKLKD